MPAQMRKPRTKVKKSKKVVKKTKKVAKTIKPKLIPIIERPTKDELRSAVKEVLQELLVEVLGKKDPQDIVLEKVVELENAVAEETLKKTEVVDKYLEARNAKQFLHDVEMSQAALKRKEAALAKKQPEKKYKPIARVDFEHVDPRQIEAVKRSSEQRYKRWIQLLAEHKGNTDKARKAMKKEEDERYDKMKDIGR